MRLRLFLVCFWLIPFTPPSHGAGDGTYFISTVYGSTAGVPQPIEHVLETRDGYLWFATEAGLARFDGLKFTVYRSASTPGLRYNSVRALFEDRSGWLWIGTEQGLSRYRNGKFEEVGPDGVSFGCFCEDRDGAVWAGGDQGLWYFREGQLRQEENEPLVEGKQIRLLKTDRSGRIWLLANRTLLFHEAGALKVYEHGGQALEGVVGTAEQGEGTLWFATSNRGVLRLRDGEITAFGTAQGLGSDITSQVYIDRKGNTWVIAAGVHVLRAEQPDRFTTVLPRSYENFQPIVEDREGNIWLGTHAEGVIRLTPTSLLAYSEADGLPIGSVRSVTQDHQDRLWLSVAQQPLMSIETDGSIKTYDAADGYGEDSYSEFTASDGSVWHGCKKGLQVTRDGEIETFPQYPQVRAIFQDSGGTIWLAPDGPVARYIKGQFEEMGGRDGVPDSAASCFAEALDGTLYIGFRKSGIATIKGGVATVHGIGSGLPTNTVRAVYIDSDGLVWVGLKGRGLALWMDGKWFNPESLSEVFDDQVSALVEDGRGNLFVGSLRGIFYARKKEVVAQAKGGPRAHFRSIVLGNGIRSDEVSASAQPAVWKARDGILWFATRQGLFGVDPARLGDNQVPPPVYIERVLVDNIPVEINGMLRLPAGARTLEIDYTALGLTRPEEALFKYRLEDYDQDWINADTRRAAYYSRLAPGSYQFRVIACNNDGVWNEIGASLSVVQAPWFFQSGWFRLLIGSVIAGAGIIGYRWKIRSVRQHEVELEQQNVSLERNISERTVELERSCEALRTSEYFYHSLVESLPQIIVRKDAEGCVTYANQAYSDLIERPLGQIIGKSDAQLHPVAAAQHYRADDLHVMQTGRPIESEYVVEKIGQKTRYLHLKKVPLFGADLRPIGVLLLFWDTTTFRETEAKLKSVQRELIEASRVAGMAEIATSVLHNIGNALNSVNTAAGIAAEKVSALKTSGVERAADLLLEQGERLVDFFGTDPRGRQMPAYLKLMSNHLAGAREEALRELGALQSKVSQINEIVAGQQEYAKGADLEETVLASELMEWALSLKEVVLHNSGIAVVRELTPVPCVRVQRQKALQILLNMLTNAIESVGDSERADKIITVGVRSSPEGAVQLFIMDNGVGIAPEDLLRVYESGYTTKKNRYGFGLHSSALAARQMAGSLLAQSAGRGLGATFVLELPASRENISSSIQSVDTTAIAPAL